MVDRRGWEGPSLGPCCMAEAACKVIRVRFEPATEVPGAFMICRRQGWIKELEEAGLGRGLAGVPPAAACPGRKEGRLGPKDQPQPARSE